MNCACKVVGFGFFILYIGITATAIKGYEKSTPKEDERESYLVDDNATISNNKLSIITQPQKFFALPSDNLSLPCNVQNNFGEDSVIWKFRNALLFLDYHKLTYSDAYSMDEDYTLHIYNFHDELAGNYTCEIPDSEIRVTHNVAQKYETSQTISAKIGDNITLHCNPKLREFQFLDKSEFEWLTEREFLIYSNGYVPAFILFQFVQLPFRVVNSSLIFHKIPYSGDVTFTCHLTKLKLNHTYYLQITSNKSIQMKPNGVISISSAERNIISAKAGESVTLPCLADNHTSTANSKSAWTESKEGQGINVISHNQRIILRNNSSGYRISENGSLIIPNFTPESGIYYECYSSPSSYIRYYSSSADESAYSDEVRKKSRKRISVVLGSKITLKCPTVARDLVWIYNDTNYLFISGKAVNININNGMKLHSNKKSLILTDFSSSMIGTYECRSITGSIYAYDITQQREINRNIVAELGTDILLPCATDSDEFESELTFVWTRNNIELLFVNQNPVAGNANIKLKIGGDDLRSLVIADFSTSLAGIYTCRTSHGMNFTFDVTTPNQSRYKKKRLRIYFGTRKVLLPCPAASNDGNASYEWYFQQVRLGERYETPVLLFINQEKFTREIYYDYFELSGNRSLIILLANTNTFGTYTCRWSTGEEYVYDVVNENDKNTIKTFSAIPGPNVTLACPTKDMADRAMNFFEWSIELQDKNRSQYTESLQFIEGKVFPIIGNSTKLPDNLKFADGGKLLIFSNVISDTKGRFQCYLHSQTLYHYEVEGSES